MEPTTFVDTPHTAHGVRLSWAQKRDMVGLVTAAVITTAITSAPFIVRRAAEEPPIRGVHGASTNLARALVASAPAARIAPTAGRRIRRPVSQAVIRLASLEPLADPASRVASLDLLPHRVVRLPSVTPPAEVEAAIVAPRKPFARKLAGLFVGDGTYSVHPFPMLPAERE